MNAHELEERDFGRTQLWDADPDVCCAAFQLGACEHTESYDEGNTLCPDYTSHYENAADLLIPQRGGACCKDVTPDEDEAIRAAADVEYQNCEGH